jgi:hypothetical protein
MGEGQHRSMINTVFLTLLSTDKPRRPSAVILLVSPSSVKALVLLLCEQC